MPITVVLLEDEALQRNGLKGILDRAAGIVIIGIAPNLREFVEVCAEHEPDVGIVDLFLDGGIENTRSGLKGPYGALAVERLRSAGIQTRCLIVSVGAASFTVQLALKRGFHGFVSKHDDVERLPTAVRSVAAGGEYWTPSLTSHFRPRDELSDTQLAILVAWAQRSAGRSDETEADYVRRSVPLSRSAFFRHRQMIVNYFGVGSLTDAVWEAVRSALIPHPQDMRGIDAPGGSVST